MSVEKSINMKNSFIKRTVVSIVIAGGMAAFATAGQAADATKVSWKASGELEEACSCRPACPCWFKSLPSRMQCDGAQILCIDKGKYGKVSVDGLYVAQFVQSPEHQTMFESFGNWNFDYVYIDEKATEEQREALKQMAAHFFPPGAKKREFRVVPITREIQGNEHITKVGSYAVCSGHLIDGGGNGHPKVVNPPLADPTHKEFLQGQTTKLSYTDAGQGWEYKDSNYMWNKFKVTSSEYEKFEAEMAKKMGGPKM
jgi:hypothetical protein